MTIIIENIKLLIHKSFKQRIYSFVIIVNYYLPQIIFRLNKLEFSLIKNKNNKELPLI